MSIREMYPYLRVKDAARAVEFYGRVFGAKERSRLVEPSGRIGHVELDLAGTILMVSEEFLELGIVGPQTIGGTGMSLHLHVDDADAVIRRAEEAGATVVRPPKDQFYGERSGAVVDPFGHEWLIGHEIEEVTPEEMQRRYTRMFE
ncbi:MAG TPA: VOC family protein [Vulgatibacter sp.]|nr:VOC family protein [Vulgatibacter sp.]